MKKLLTLVVVALVAFGLSAAASWTFVGPEGPLAAFLGLHDESADAQTKPENDHEGTAHKERGKPLGALTAGMHAGQLAGGGDGATPAHGGEVHLTDASAPAAVPPSYVAGVDDVLQLAASSRDRLKVVRERETQLAAREAQMELVLEDIRGEHAAMDALRKQVSDEMKALEAQLAEFERKQTELSTQEQALDGHRASMEGEERVNIKKMATVYDSMAADSAAKIFSQMVKGGNTDTAVKLLSMMKERQAAKVLAEMSDPAIAADLSEKIRSLKRPDAPPAAEPTTDP